MNILYLGYWSVLDGLSESTIRPHLEVLDAMPEVNKIVYISIERTTEMVTCSWPIAKMDFIPFYSPPKSFLRDKVSDFTILPNLLVKLCKEGSIDKIICRSSLAGAIGYLVWKRVKIPYFVESFEPHADYMLESGVWSKWDIRYRLQKYFEKKQKETASAIMPVSNNYKRHLVEREQVKCRVETIPCSVDLEKFQFDKKKRAEIRQQLGIRDDATVGIYVGKFGGIYYEEETFKFMASCFDRIDSFYLIILSPQDKEFLRSKINEYKIPRGKLWYSTVPHSEVPSFLCAADFAFCPVKPTPNRQYCSPVKNGEYWANGLPIVIADGIGDDSDIIKTYKKGGIVVDYKNDTPSSFLAEIVQQCASNRTSNECVDFAKKFRDPSMVNDVYLNHIIKSEK